MIFLLELLICLWVGIIITNVYEYFFGPLDDEEEWPFNNKMNKKDK